jgi:cytochrome c biogenesis protein ResB
VDTALAYPLIQKSLTTFIPLGEVGLWTWLTSYGRLTFSHTFWFYGLLVGVTFLGVNSFVCSTIRVWAILGPRRKKGWLLKLGPHFTHYAVVVMLLGYLGSYTLAEALPGRALVPDGPPFKLPKNLGFVSARLEKPKIYAGQRLEFFDQWYLDPGIVLSFKKPSGDQTFEARIAYNQPVRYAGYNFYLADFYPKNATSAGMGGYKTIKLTIRRDPAANIYIAGIIIFAVGVALYLADLAQTFRKRGQKA